MGCCPGEECQVLNLEQQVLQRQAWPGHRALAWLPWVLLVPPEQEPQVLPQLESRLPEQQGPLEPPWVLLLLASRLDTRHEASWLPVG
jgi:hypothetical protein